MERVKKPSDKWYSRAHWRNLRKLVLHRDPLCYICLHAPSTEVDHVIPHRGNWALFSDLKNLGGICHQCHSAKTARENCGFGNPEKAAAGPFIAPTGGQGREWLSSTVSSADLDKALELPDGFLDGI